MQPSQIFILPSRQPWALQQRLLMTLTRHFESDRCFLSVQAPQSMWSLTTSQTKPGSRHKQILTIVTSHNIHRVISYYPISLSYVDVKPLFFRESSDVSVALGMTILDHPVKLQTLLSVARHRDGWGVAAHGIGVEVKGHPVEITTKILPHLGWMGIPPSRDDVKPIM